MTYTFRQQFVSPSKYGLKCPYPMDAQYITVHETYNDAPAKNEINYLCSNTSSTGFHFAIDDKEVVQAISTNRNAWHCGDGNGNGNRKSIGVEICYSKSGGARYEKAKANAIKFIVKLLKERGWGIDRVKKHQDWNKKHCPHRMLDEGKWNAFIAEIEKELKKLTKPKSKIMVTGGFKDEVAIAKIIKLFLNREWWFGTSLVDNSVVFTTGGLSGQNLIDAEAFFKQNNWWYEIKEV
jgi:N-acetylmuramoyl-L-alanine amidase